jgi:cytochrome c peroxidase
MIYKRILFCLAVPFFSAAVATLALADLTPLERLGEFLYFDTDLSEPGGQSCASCHSPEAGFADPDTDLPVSQGVLPKNRFGNRNSPSAAYAMFSPIFHFDEEESLWIGGQFWDGRATGEVLGDPLADQALGPFVNILEMNNPNKLVVINEIRRSDYADLFEQVWGEGSLDDVEAAYDQVALSIAAFERTSLFAQFSSKYDYYLAGNDVLTEKELRGLALFEDENKGKCALCHVSQPGSDGSPPLFTDFTYDNLGTPKNPNNPFYDLPPKFNPDGEDFVDYGLGGVLGLPEEMGKFKVMTLRNIAITPPYMHNGVFSTLHEVVDFYNTRDLGGWPPPEVPENVNQDELGNLGLTEAEVDTIVAFLETLTDGYVPPANLVASSNIPHGFALQQNYPNPFNPETEISFSLPEMMEVSLTVYNILGQEVKTLLNGEMDAGTHTIHWNARDNAGNSVASGVYFYRLKTEIFNQTMKMVLMK